MSTWSISKAKVVLAGVQVLCNSTAWVTVAVRMANPRRKLKNFVLIEISIRMKNIFDESHHTLIIGALHAL
jgi:hypothetical protein